jgi:hypothetical protein
MIPSINGNSAPKGCNPVSSNCVIWQGPNLPCIDLCTGDSISAVVAKLCEQLVALKGNTASEGSIDVTALSPGCLQEIYPDLTFENLDDYINALVAYVCSLDPDATSSITLQQKDAVVRVPDCFGGIVAITNGGMIITSITDVATAQSNGVNQINTTATFEQQALWNAYLDEAGVNPGFTLNTPMSATLYMVLESTVEDLYTVAAGQGAFADMAWADGTYRGWGHLAGNALCQLISCTNTMLPGCLSGEGSIDIPAVERPSNGRETRSSNQPLSKANKQLVERMIKSQVQKSTVKLPKIISRYVLTNKTGKAVEMNVLLAALEKEFGILRNMAGTATDMREAITRQPMNLDNEKTLSGNTIMGMLPGFYKTPNNLSQSLANAWMTIADIRNAVVDIQKNITLTTSCEDIVYDVKGSLITSGSTVTGIKLDFSGTKVNSPFMDCGQGSKITIEDTDFNTITKYVNVVNESKNYTGTDVSFQGTSLNLASNYKVNVDICFTDGDSQCAKSYSFVVENNQSCPKISFTGSTANTIGFKLENVQGSAYDLTVVCESVTGNEYGRRVYTSPNSTINDSFTGLPAGKTVNIYAELKSRGSGAISKCPTVSTATSTPACVTHNVFSRDYANSFTDINSSGLLRLACYNDTTSTHSTIAGWDSLGNFKVVKCTDDTNTSCISGDPISSTGNFISNSSETQLIIGTTAYNSSVAPNETDSGWKYSGALVGPDNNTYYIYSLVNKNSNTVDQVVASCECALNFKLDKPMYYAAPLGSVACHVNIVGQNNITITSDYVTVTSQPYRGNVSYDESLSSSSKLVFTYNNTYAGTDFVNDSFKFKVATSCGESTEMIVPITVSRKQSSVTDDVFVYVNTTSMDYTDAVDLKATFEAMKVKMQATCTNWTGSIYYIPVDSGSDAGDYLNYPKSLIDMKAGASGSITVAGGSWTTWKSLPSYWNSGSKESPSTSATIFAFTNETSSNANYAHTNLSDGWIGQPTASYQTQYEELQDLLTGTEVTAWGAANDTALKYFGTSGVRFKQVLIPIIDSKTGESAAAALQMYGAIYGRTLKLAETNAVKVGNIKYPVNLTNYLLESSSAAQAPYSMVTSNNVNLTGLTNSNFTIASWLDKGDDLSTTNLNLQNNLMQIMGLDSTLFGTNCSTEVQCSYKMSDGGVVLWGRHDTVAATACSQATNAANCMEVYHPTSSTAFAGISYKSAAGACAGDASDEIESGFYARFNGSGTTYDRYVKTVGWHGSPGTC